MSVESRRSRAAAELAGAPTAPCPHCERTTKTVQGVCADCWGVKDPAVAMDFRPPQRTEPLFGDFDLDIFGLGPLVLMAAVPVLLAVVVAAVILAVR